ncbi:Fic family protein [Paractinoplanes atraurantiacus]|uniref:Fic family protein n=1 Tax=Paractinoplanes atraurantiacus TaxID=1036182 RepID=UPI001C5490AA|nr:Fic family protein [Actinoplanes atraurantiacus]
MTPGYGETLVPDDEVGALLPQIRHFFDEPISKAAVYDLEQAVQDQVGEELHLEILGGELTVPDLLSDHFLRQLHRWLYADIWSWGGIIRKHELNIGIDPWLIAVELRSGLENVKYRWGHTDDWNPRQLGIATHAEMVRIHPFADGDGRSTRLFADLVFVAAQLSEGTADGQLMKYDWKVDKVGYIGMLREYDAHRNPEDLADFINLRPFSG